MSSLTRTELLTMLLYGLDKAMRPTMSNLFRGDDLWQEYHHHHRSQINGMKTDGLIKFFGQKSQSNWAVELTKAGKLRAIGGRDAPAAWARPWDGEWNILMFDLENSAQSLRQKLLRWLRGNGFGCLQQSVWITPDPVGSELDDLLKDYGDRADHILVLRSKIETRNSTKRHPTTIATQAWNFDFINAGYREYLNLIKTTMPKRPTPAGARAWVKAEHASWSRAFNNDPLLPMALLPKGYLGHEAWEKRWKALSNATPMTVALQPDDEESSSSS